MYGIPFSQLQRELFLSYNKLKEANDTLKQLQSQKKKSIPSEFTSREIKKKNPLIEESEKIMENVNIPVIMGGGVNNQNQINNILNKSKIEFISMQRPFVADPTFLVEWELKGNGQSKCIMCNNCYWKKTSTCFFPRSCKDKF